jgi:predicted ribosomally synthesized peptide with nif11-like leader
MSETAARDFVRRVESDEEFAGELEALKSDPQAVQQRVRAAGFDVGPDEIRAAFLDRWGDRLSPEQLEAVAAGALDQSQAGIVFAGSALIVYGMSAAAAAAF